MRDLLDKCKTLLETAENNPMVESGEEYAEGYFVNHGLCSTLDTFRLEEFFATWEHYSGDWEYPIPGYAGMTAEDAYVEHTSRPFDTTHEYCRLRVDLLKHIITCLEAEDGSMA